MNEPLADELRILLNHYEKIASFVNAEVRNNMTEEEDAMFLQWLDNYEILIYKTAKNFVENFSLEDYKNCSEG